MKGKAYFKQQIARRVLLDVSTLPYRQDLLDDLKGAAAPGPRIVLATGCDMQIAGQVADHLKLFDAVFASDGIANLSGESKRKRLVNEFGEKGFDYAGDHRNDRSVWASARESIVVAGPETRAGADYLKPLRPQHWLKNILIFVPLIAAQRFFETRATGEGDSWRLYRSDVLPPAAICSMTCSTWRLTGIIHISGFGLSPPAISRSLTASRCFRS